MKNGTFYIVGTGPGDPKLLTIKGAEILEKCPVWFTPSAFKEKSKSTAFEIVSAVVKADGKKILNHYFPMKKIHRGKKMEEEVLAAWENGAKLIMEHLGKGEDVAFPTLGDPGIYSTALYVCETLQRFGSPFTVEIIPGVSAISAISAEAQLPLCLGDERMVVLPATFENGTLKELLKETESAVFMKVGAALDKLLPLLEELNLVDNAVLIERCSMEGQRVWRNIRMAKGEKLHYFSTLIVRTNKEGHPLM